MENLASEFGTVNYLILGLYLAGMVAVGVFLARSQKTSEQYFLAGRSMPWLVVALSMFASLTSAVTYLGIPAMAYSDNVSIIFGVMVSPLVAPLLIVLFYPAYRKYNVTTSYEYIYHRFGAPARYCVSGLFVLARLGWLGTVIFAPALALSTVTGMNINLAIALMGILATAYTCLGGLTAVLWTDLAQFIILLAGAVWVAITLTVNAGGPAEIFSLAGRTGRLDMMSFDFNVTQMTAAAAMLSFFLSFSQDYGTDQVTVQRLLSIRKQSGIAKAVVFNSVSDVVINALLLYIGLGLLAWFTQNPRPALNELSADCVLPFYIINALPAGVSGLIITAVFAAAMSSMDSGIHSVSTVIINDFVRPARKSPLSESKTLVLARTLVIALGLTATAAALYASRIGSIIKAWSTFMSLFSAPVLVIFVMGITMRFARFRGWLVAVIISVPVTFLVQTKTDTHWIYYFPVSFISCLVPAVIFSLIPARTGK